MNAKNIIIRILFSLLCITFFQGLSAQEEDPFFEQEAQRLRKEAQRERKQDFDENVRIMEGMIQGDERATQARSYKNIDSSLRGFLNTKLMKRFKGFKLEVEGLVSTFKADQYNTKAEDIVKVKKAYTAFVDKYNYQLQEIKRDFLNPKKHKVIRKYPDMYAATLELKLRDLADIYAQDLQKTIMETNGTEEYSAIPLAMVLSMVKFGVDFTQYLVRMRFESRRVKEEHMDRFFIEPYQLKSWQEIEVISGRVGGDMYSPSYNNYDQMDYNNNNPEYRNDQEYNPNEQENINEINPFEPETETPKKKEKTEKKDNVQKVKYSFRHS